MPFQLNLTGLWNKTGNAVADALILERNPLVLPCDFARDSRPSPLQVQELWGDLHKAEERDCKTFRDHASAPVEALVRAAKEIAVCSLSGQAKNHVVLALKHSVGRNKDHESKVAVLSSGWAFCIDRLAEINPHVVAKNILQDLLSVDRTHAVFEAKMISTLGAHAKCFAKTYPEQAAAYYARISCAATRCRRPGMKLRLDAMQCVS